MKKIISRLRARMKEDNRLRVKKSYYTFSREYPAGNIPIKRRKNKKLYSGALKAVLTCLLCAILVCLSFFAVTVGIEVSESKPDEAESTVEQAGESLLASDGVRAIYMPYEYLGNERQINKLIREAERKDCNSVVITFKTEDGKLNYSSALEYAIKGRCSSFYNDTVRAAVSLFEEGGLAVIAKLYCFSDEAVASTTTALAVKYMDTDINWLDGSDENGGKPWIDPCLEESRGYIIGIMKELYSLGIKGFILENCSFPDSKNIGSATFADEGKPQVRNDALRRLFADAKAALPEDCFILMSYTATDAVNGNEALFSGSLSDADYNGYTADLSVRDPGYTVDKKTKYSSMLGLFALINANNPDKEFIPVISIEEYSSRYISAITKAGYNNYIIYAADGNY